MAPFVGLIEEQVHTPRPWLEPTRDPAPYSIPGARISGRLLSVCWSVSYTGPAQMAHLRPSAQGSLDVLHVLLDLVLDIGQGQTELFEVNQDFRQEGNGCLKRWAGACPGIELVRSN